MDRSCPSRKEVTHARPDSHAGHFGVLAGTWNPQDALVAVPQGLVPALLSPRGHAPPMPYGRMKIVVATQAPISLPAGGQSLSLRWGV
jgi:hypothetical protein